MPAPTQFAFRKRWAERVFTVYKKGLGAGTLGRQDRGSTRVVASGSGMLPGRSRLSKEPGLWR